jgi:5'-3' exoribonuclease 2
LIKRYPKILIEAREELEIGFNLNELHLKNFGVDERIPPIDNLYFDMNGIIHPCAHPDDRESPSSLAEMFNSIFDYCDKLIRIIRPRKLIYMAIDGVAPRAKMNQQRSRRFRAALSAQQNERVTANKEKEWKEKGLPTDFLDRQKKEKFKFDSNCITPGTDFLEQCSIAVRTYIKSRLNNDPLWSNLNVVFSDASVPGEGEHKILDFIRTQRTYDTYDPNTYHCIYGADADLIMLSLIMHEPHFCVIRETLSDKYYMVCENCGKHGHRKEECDSVTGKFIRSKATKEEIMAYNKEKIDEIEFSLIKIGILREYLELEFRVLIETGKDLERIIDDFVFLCFLVGNDFLPNMPSLKIREGAIDAMVYLYKKIRPEMNDYLTNGKGQLNLNECEKLFKKLSLVEDKFFKNEMEMKIRDNERRRINDINKQKTSILNEFRSIPNVNNNKDVKSKGKKSTKKTKKDIGNKDEIDLVNIVGNINTIEKDENLQKHFNLENLKLHGEDIFKNIVKEAINEESKQKVSQYVDKIKLGEIGWKDRYYMEKFHVSSSVNEKALIDLKQKIKQYYIEGLCWVFEYYYNGCKSWSWFYPFHYAPFASDLVNLNSLKINFDLNKPFFAFEQLLSVLPPYSAEALPLPFRKLMTDPLSPISDFYPSNIKLDINNQPFEWMGVNLLPFIDADRVQKVVKSVFDKCELTEKDKKLNERGENILISRDYNILNYFQGDLYINEQMNTFGKNIKDDSEIKGIHPGDIKSDKCQIYNFRKKSGFKNHCSQILNGVRKEPKCVFEDNLETYNKSYFNGKSAIEIVKEVIGCQYDDVESKMIREWFDPKYGNNNMGIPDDPQLKFLFMKRRAQENESKSHQLKEINKPKNIHEKKNIQQKMNINKKNEKENDIEKPEENIIPLNEEEQTKKENAKTKKKIGEKKENKNEDKSKKEVNLGLFNKLSDLMSGLNNFKKKKI